MGKKRSAAMAAPVFLFRAADAGTDHFSDYGLDPYFCQPEPTQRPSSLEFTRYKLQKHISKKHHHNKQQQRRRWWSSTASYVFLLFKRLSSSSNPNLTPGTASRASPYGGSSPVLLYLTDDDDDCGNGATAACACWAPTMWSGHLATAELGATPAYAPYVSLRNANLIRRRVAGGGSVPAMPIYLVT